MNTASLYILTGASRGLGRAMAEALLAPGHRLLTLARRPDASLEAIAQARGAELTQWAVDLADAAPVAARLAEWIVQAGQPGPTGTPQRAILINNAALVGHLAPLSAQADTEARRQGLADVLRVGLEAPMLLTAAFLQATAAWNRSPPFDRRVLNISSGLGRRPMAGSAGYCAVKAGMDHFSRCVALEEQTRPGGARIESVAPGVIDTDMQTTLRAADADGLPDRERFIQLQAQGQLSSAAHTARQLLDHLHSARFGDEVVSDIRSL